MDGSTTNGATGDHRLRIGVTRRHILRAGPGASATGLLAPIAILSVRAGSYPALGTFLTGARGQACSWVSSRH